MLATHWFRHWRDTVGFPDTYVVVDLETNGLSPDSCLIVQLAYCKVENREIVIEKSEILDWTREPGIDQAAFSSGLVSTAKAVFDRDGTVYPFTRDRIAREGVEPIQSLRDYYVLLAGCKLNGMPLVGHNCVSFDRKFLEKAFTRFLGLPYMLSGNDMFDTGLLEKASQLDSFDARPRPGETSMQWAGRIAAIRAPGVRWSLGGHCLAKYGFDVSHGISKDNLHDAGQDCRATHLLFEKYRELAEECAHA